MQRTYVRRRRLVAALLFGVVLTLGSPVARAFGGSDEPTDGQTEGQEGGATYVVGPGDTLWSIAERHEPGDDPRSVILEIVELNGLDDDPIVPGQTLALPAGG